MCSMHWEMLWAMWICVQHGGGGDWSAREGVGVFALWGFKVSNLLHTSGEFFGIMTIGVDPCS